MVLLSGRTPHVAALLIAAAVLSLDYAEAACTPPSPGNNTVVTCTGTTTNTDPGLGIGFGGLYETGNTYNIGASATIEGTNWGLSFLRGTVNNAGTIAGGIGLIVHSSDPEIALVLNSTGTISGNNVSAIISNASVTITNGGLITSSAYGVLINSSLGNSTILNSGVITAGDTGVRSAEDISIVNSGTILGNASGITGKSLALTNSGTIVGGERGAFASLIAVTNLAQGRIEATGLNGNAIRASVSASVLNEGEILASGSNGIAIMAKNMGATNSGTISGAQHAVSGTDFTLVNLAGGYVAGDEALSATNSAIIDNAGTIRGGISGVTGAVVDVSNSGVISASATNGRAIEASQSITVKNSGSIVADSGGAIISANVTIANAKGGVISGSGGAVASTYAVVNNDGTIRSTAANSHALVGGNSVQVTNTGVIAGGVGAVTTGGLASVWNAGMIVATGPNGIGISGDRSTIVNSGSISGTIGIRATEAASITNSGSITGTGGTAIKLTNASDTLTVLPGSRINGVVDMGFGTGDIVTAAVVAPTTRLSSLTSVTLPTLINFEGRLNVTYSGGGFNGPTVTSGLQLATLDPTALAVADRALLDFTGGVSALVSGRLGGAPASGSGMTSMAYAPDSDTSGPFVKIPGRNVRVDPAPITVWANSFGGRRQQDETVSTLASITTSWGGAIGIDRKLRPDWLVGAFVGGGAGQVSVALGSQTVDTDYVFAGGYSRFEWASQFVDVTLQGGNASNASKRLVLNNGVGGGLQTATASYHGWFISPEIAYGHRFEIGNGYVLTPTARLRYVAGMFDGYSETGSAQNLSIGARTLQNIEERGELNLSQVTSLFGGDHLLKTNLHGGVIAMQRLGDASTNAILIGQRLSFATPGSGSTVGAVAGAGFDYQTSRNVAVFGAIEGMMMSDNSRTATAKGGLRVAF